MNIILNGDNYPLTDKTTVGELVSQLNLQNKRIAIEVNKAIIPRSNYEGVVLRQGDQVEIVHAIGGG